MSVWGTFINALPSTILAKLWGFLSCGLKTFIIGDKHLVCPVHHCIGRPSGAGPFPGTLNVRRASDGGLTFIPPPRFDQLLPTVLTVKLCRMPDFEA